MEIRTQYRIFFLGALLLAVCTAWLVPFVSIMLYGTHVVQEPNPVILTLEVASLLYIALYGVCNMVRAARVVKNTPKIVPDVRIVKIDKTTYSLRATRKDRKVRI